MEKKEKKPSVPESQAPAVQRRQPGTDIVGYMSRIDAGSDGYRRGLLLQAAERFRESNVDCIYLVGGLVSKRAVTDRIRLIQANEKDAQTTLLEELQGLMASRDKLASTLKGEKEASESKKVQNKLAALDEKTKKAKDRLAGLKPRKSAVVLEEIIEQLAVELAEALPRFQKKDGKKIKVYIVTSPAYDGAVGHRVALRLVELRAKERDVFYFGQVRNFVKLKKSDKGVVLLTPEKDVWRSRFYSAYPDRLVEDDLKRGSKTAPEMYVVGCFGSSLNRHKGSNDFQRISLPVLHKLENTTTGENMVGVRVVEYTHDGDNRVRTFDFKHMTTNERMMIPVPSKCSKVQTMVIEDLKVHGKRSIGQWEDELGVPRDVLEKELKDLLEKRSKSVSLVYDEKAAQYSFDSEWLQKKLAFKWPESGEGWSLNTTVGFSCAHAGSVHTAEKFIINELPDILVEEDADVLFDAGDTIEGLKHELDRRKEVMPGFNYTKMERLGAALFSAAMLRSFEKRITKTLKDKDPKKMAQEEVRGLVRKLLVTFAYICGNHDEWELDIGVDPLAHFDVWIRKLVCRGVDKILREKGLPTIPYHELEELVDQKVLFYTEDDSYTYASGITVGAVHYHAGRTATNSTWPERALRQFREHHRIVGNFHVEEHVEEYDAKLGLRASDMMPTLKCKSDFEKKKGKIVDFGVGVRKMWSYKGQVLVTESGLRGKNPNVSVNVDAVFQAHCKEIGIDLNDKK